MSLLEALRPALGDADEGGTQHPVADHEAGLDDLNDVPLGTSAIGNLEHGLVHMRVEFLAHRVELLDAVPLQGLQEVPFRQLDAFEEALERVVGAGPGLVRDTSRCRA